MSGMDVCSDNRFELIAKARDALLESTNIEDSHDEMAVLDSIIFRCWQMGWLDRLDVVRCRDCKWCMAYSKAVYCDRFAHGLPTAELDGFCAWGERK